MHGQPGRAADSAAHPFPCSSDPRRPVPSPVPARDTAPTRRGTGTRVWPCAVPSLGLWPGEQRLLHLGGFLPVAVAVVSVGVGFHRFRLRFHGLPFVVHQALLRGSLGVPGLGEGRLRRLGILGYIAVDGPAGQRQHQVAAVVPECGQALLGQLPRRLQGDLELLATSLTASADKVFRRVTRPRAYLPCSHSSFGLKPRSVRATVEGFGSTNPSATCSAADRSENTNN